MQYRSRHTSWTNMSTFDNYNQSFTSKFNMDHNVKFAFLRLVI